MWRKAIEALQLKNVKRKAPWGTPKKKNSEKKIRRAKAAAGRSTIRKI